MKADAIQLTILMENTNIARTSPAKLVQFILSIFNIL